MQEKFYTKSGIGVYSKEKILDSLLTLGRERNIKTTPSALYTKASKIVAGLIENLNTSHNEYYLSRNPKWAKGFEQDNIFIDKQMIRKIATRSFLEVEVTFKDIVAKDFLRGEITLEHPSGVIFENIPFSKGDSLTQKVSFQSKTTGVLSNVPILDDPTLSIIEGNAINLAIQTKVGEGGSDRESDDTFQARYYLEPIRPGSLYNLTEAGRAIQGVHDIRFFFNSSSENTYLGVPPLHTGIALTTSTSYNDDPATDWGDFFKKNLWDFFIKNLDHNVRTITESGTLISFPHINNYVTFYAKPLIYTATVSIKIHLNGTYPTADIFQDASIKEEMTNLGTAVLTYAQEILDAGLTSLEITKVAYDKIQNEAEFSNLRQFVSEIILRFVPSKDGEEGGEINLNQNQTIQGAVKHQVISRYDTVENPHIEVILNNV